MSDIRSKIKKEAAGVRKAVRGRVLTSLSAGFALVVGLAWNDAISSFIKLLFPVDASAILPKFIYALVLTVFVTLVIIGLERTLKEPEEEVPPGL